ncbi:lon protease homolog 2, peroxisomal-like isoform X2 [Magnolia sinica]|uniref:lon protease homolog 2, peroxisomal-like isoform X2 n=1 Tax=Magnolia sinica TaxID=86752 RepID=UPI00265A4BFB|nr:lon protease homolog 2, peroxisomal-like isoform X2 [Magnolia sinica]
MEVIPMGVNGHEISNALRSTPALVVDETMLEKILGPPRFDDRETAERMATPGVSVGLVWTSFGGDVQFVEATSMVGKGDLHLTGQLGDVIKESTQIALTWKMFLGWRFLQSKKTHHCQDSIDLMFQQMLSDNRTSCSCSSAKQKSYPNLTL